MKNRTASLIFSAIFVLLIAVPYVAENVTGKARREKIVQRMKDAGLKTSLEEFAVEMPPEERNFAAIPVIQALMDFEQVADGDLIYANKSLREDFIKLVPPKPINGKLPMGWWRQEKLTDLLGLIEQMQEDDRFEVPETGTEARRILAALHPMNHVFEMVDEAALRPEAQLEIKYGTDFAENMAMATPWLRDIRQHVAIQKVRAIASLHAGDTDQSIKALRAMAKLAEASASQPSMINQLIRITSHSMMQDVIWEGLMTSQWNDNDLEALIKLMSETGSMTHIEKGFNYEIVALFLDMADYFKNADSKEGHTALLQLTGAPDDSFSWLDLFFFRLIPDGFWDHNAAYGAELIFDYCITPIRNNEYTNLPLIAEEVEKHSLHSLLPRVAAPAYDGILASAIYRQTNFDLLRIGCALERYRRENGDYPDSLNQLTSDLPKDPMSQGDDFLYSKENNTYILYSRGLNGTDDKARENRSSTGKLNYKESDWVLRSPNTLN